MLNTEMLQSILELRKPAIIGISGFGGSGKSTFARELAMEINAPVIGVDSFYKTTGMTDYQLWNIMDYSRMVHEVLKPYLSGSDTISYGEFNWEKNQVINTNTVAAKSLLIIEGVGLLRPELLEYFAYTIWINCPIEEAIARGKRRDREDYGVIQDESWDGVWKDNDLQCFQVFDPLRTADFILDCVK